MSSRMGSNDSEGKKSRHIKVSVIIPAYNAEDTIRETLESVLAQTSPDWEVVVVDDGSTDRTADFVSIFVRKDSRIKMIHQGNQGEAGARNTGLEMARHEWLLFLDSDDWIAPVYLERMTQELLSNPELDAVHCGYARVASDGALVVDDYRPPSGNLFPTLARRAAFPIHACVVRRSLVESVGKFDTSLRTCTDWDLWQRIARTGARFGAVREVLAFYRMRPGGASLDAYRLLKDDLRVLKQGHSADPRVKNPHPDHVNGLPKELIPTQEFYLLCWCAGLLLGKGMDACPLLELLEGESFPQLYPDAVAQCIFEAGILPLCKTQEVWERLYLDIRQHVQDFLLALERHSKAPGLAEHAGRNLTKLILKHSPAWHAIIEDYETLEISLARAEQKQIVLKEERDELQNRLGARTAERDALLGSEEYRFGSYLLNLINRFHLRRPLGFAWWLWTAGRQSLSVWKLAFDRKFMTGRQGRLRALTTVCTDFPIYSQTFVYQEITQLARNGFDLRLVYSKLNSRDFLHTQFAELWAAKRRLNIHWKIHKGDFDDYQARMPEKVESLISMLCGASGLSRQVLVSHDNFLQAFSFTRMVESYRPHYLHSYFFYDRSLMALVAGFLLGIPRGISCYADHQLKDYELKVVPLHLELCDLVIATSERIKRELLEIAPATDANKILVKVNAINADRFPVRERREPTAGESFRLVCVSRIEPKKGLIYLVEAVDLLRKKGWHLLLHLVGAGDEVFASQDYKRKLDQRITELGLRDTVHLEGRQNEEGVLRFLHLSHLFVAPFIETKTGDKDGIPTAVLEAMSTGLPVVATDAGSTLEVIEDDREGLVVRQRDPAALAQAIETLIRDPQRRRQMGEAAAQRARREFDVRVCEKAFHDRVRALAKPSHPTGQILLAK